MKLGFCTLVASLGVASTLRRSKGKKGDCYRMFDGQPLVQFSVSSQAEVTTIMAKLDDLECTEMSGAHSSELFAICGAAKVETLRMLYGANVTVLSEDAGDFYRQTSGVPKDFKELRGAHASDFYADWRSYQTRMARVESLVASCGGAAKLEQIGSSVEGRPIMAVRFRGAGWTSGSARIIVDYELHAREWITGMAGIYAIDHACQKLREEPDWLANTELVIAPAMNPDGVIYSETDNRMWRKNMADNNGNRCKGVDLNRNWDPNWAGSHSTSSSPCSDVFYGSSAFSEPETQALKSVLDEAPVSIHLDVHSYTNLILAPYSGSWEPHPRRDEIDVPGELMLAAMKGVHNEIYTYGGNEILYPASGVCPDYISSKGSFGYTFELRPRSRWGSGGFAPPPDQILPGSEEAWAGVLAGISWAQNPTTTAAPPTPAPTPPSPTPTGCPPAYSTGPDGDGDCRCNSGLSCYENGAPSCTFSYTADNGHKSKSWFLETCSGCKCQ